MLCAIYPIRERHSPCDPHFERIYGSLILFVTESMRLFVIVKEICRIAL